MTGTISWPLAFAIGAVFGGVTLWWRFLTVSGAMAGGLFAASLLALGGAAWAVPSLAFFVLSSLLSKLRSARKRAAEAHYEKGGVRDAGQVLANGAAGWVLLLAHAAWPSPVLYGGFLGAFAAATADTWATEIGALSPVRPRLITTFRPVAAGTSGAVSSYGLIGALAGAIIIWAAALPFMGGLSGNVGGWIGLLAVGGAGLAGALADSLLGATVQAQYLDSGTGKMTERRESAGIENELVRGWRWMHNDSVNLICTVTGALVAMVCAQAFGA